jgi:hypothetical protein
MKITIAIAALAAGIALMALASPEHEASVPQPRQIDRIIGSGEFNTVYPISYADQSIQRKQYSDGLLKLVALFRTRDLSGMPEELRAERERNLQRLLEYRERGIFPVNYDHPDRILPCFIDSTGAICAAGYLIEKSAGRAFAEQINREYKYATVAEMNSPAIDRWIARSGFSREEIATIQRPSLRPPTPVATQALTSTDDRFDINLSGTVSPPTPTPAPAVKDTITAPEVMPAVPDTAIVIN